MNKLALFNQLTVLEAACNQQQEQYLCFRGTAIDQLSELKMKVISSFMSVSAVNSTEDHSDIEQDLRKVFDMDKINALSTYSRYNTIVWMRRYIRQLASLRGEDRRFKEHFKGLLQEIEHIEHRLREMRLQKREKERMDTVIHLKGKIQYLLGTVFDAGDTSGFLDLLPGLFFGDWTMDKTNFLSLISLNRDRYYLGGLENETMAQLKQLPDEMNYPAFMNAVFVQHLEHDQDGYLFDLYFEDAMKRISGNEELSEQMSGKFQESFGPIPTYTAYTDSDGRIQHLDPNKPDLKVVK